MRATKSIKDTTEEDEEEETEEAGTVINSGE